VHPETCESFPGSEVEISSAIFIHFLRGACWKSTFRSQRHPR
jgi:hypothetical protein